MYRSGEHTVSESSMLRLQLRALILVFNIHIVVAVDDDGVWVGGGWIRHYGLFEGVVMVDK